MKLNAIGRELANTEAAAKFYYKIFAAVEIW